MTYGDGLADVNILDLIEFHKSHGKLATVTAVQPEGRFGMLEINNDQKALIFMKSQLVMVVILMEVFVLSPKTLDYIVGDNSIWEQDPMKKLALDGQLKAFKHTGFWRPMDTLRDKNLLLIYGMRILHRGEHGNSM